MKQMIIRLALEKFMLYQCNSIWDHMEEYKKNICRTQDICRLDYPNRWRDIEKASEILFKQFRDAMP